MTDFLCFTESCWAVSVGGRGSSRLVGAPSRCCFRPRTPPVALAKRPRAQPRREKLLRVQSSEPSRDAVASSETSRDTTGSASELNDFSEDGFFQGEGNDNAFEVESAGDMWGMAGEEDAWDADDLPDIDVGNLVADEILKEAGYVVKSMEEPSKGESDAASKADEANVNASPHPVVDGDAPVNTSLLLEFERQGHCALPGLFDPRRIETLANVIRAELKNRAMDAYRQKLEVLLGKEASSAAESPESAQKMLDEAGLSVPFLQLFNLHETVPEVASVAKDPALGRVAADLLGVDAVRLYQDSVFWKRPGDAPTPYHADLSMMPVDTNHAVTFFIPLRSLPGGKFAPSLRFASGSHRDVSLLYWNAGVGAAGRAAALENGGAVPPTTDLSGRYPEVSHGAMEVGSATAHHGFCLHSSPGISSESRGRIALSICFVSADARVLPKAQQHLVENEDSWSHRRWLKKSKAGKPLKHPALPLVFTREAV